MSSQATPAANTLDSVSEALIELGFSEAESLVFTTLLSRGPRQASSLAKFSGLARTYTYAILDKLTGRGLVSVHERRGVRHFSAVPFEELLILLKQKQTALERHQEQLRSVAGLFQPQTELWTDPVTRSDKGAESRARLFQELTAGIGETRFLFCRAEGSTLFDEAPYPVEGLKQILVLGGPGLHILLFSQTTRGAEIASEINSSLVTVVDAHLESELLLSERKVMIIGNTAQTPCSITFEQPALSATLRTFASSFFFATKALEMISQPENPGDFARVANGPK